MMDGMPIQSCLSLGGRVSSGTKGEGTPRFKNERCKEEQCDDSHAMQIQASRNEGNGSRKPDQSQDGEE